MAVTTNDLAKICHVSRTTVLRALNGTGRINEETKKRILKAAEENGYKPDMLARALAKSKTYTIGIVVLDVMNQHFAQILNAVEKEASRLGYSVNIMLHGQDGELEKKLIDRMTAYHVDGIILSTVNKGEDYISYLRGLNTPLVTIDNKLSDQIPFVGVDNRAAMKNLTEKAIRKQYRRIVFVCPPLHNETQNIYAHEQRYQGFCDGFAVGAEGQVAEQVVIREENYMELCENLILPDRGTAFLCSGDIFALDLMKFLRKKELLAGTDYGIAGFDNVTILDYVTPRMDTVDNHDSRIGIEALHMLIQLINHEETAQELILDTEYMNGKTL